MWINRCDRNTYVGVGERRMKMKLKTEKKIKAWEGKISPINFKKLLLALFVGCKFIQKTKGGAKNETRNI